MWKHLFYTTDLRFYGLGIFGSLANPSPLLKMIDDFIISLFLNYLYNDNSCAHVFLYASRQNTLLSYFL